MNDEKKTIKNEDNLKEKNTKLNKDKENLENN